MRLAEVVGGTVVNVVEVAEPRPDWADGWPEAGRAGVGWTFAGGVFTPPAGWVAPDAIAALRVQAVARVNALAGDRRRTFITWIPGQEMLYLQKLDEARTYQNTPGPVLSDFPLIAAEIGITGAGAAEIAAIWLAMAAQWKAAAAQIETARLGTIMVIEGAASADAIHQALTAYAAVMA